ncbi:MAG: GNAT family N-acetyltransferase, partial [Holdemanella sp.]|nr:GNAT family N-acetyltransferase [Holdemanella sp.]
MDIHKFSNRYEVKALKEEDINSIYSLLKGNEKYYTYCPPMINKESIIEDMYSLPDGKELKDKYYVGYYDHDQLIALLDLIDGYPFDDICYIGFFIMDVQYQNKGIGTDIINELSNYLKEEGYAYIQLAWLINNIEASHFWKKNGFMETREGISHEEREVIVASKDLNPYFLYGEKEMEYLKKKDKKLAKVIDEYGFIRRTINHDLFYSLIECIIGQQISTKAQKTICKRLKDALPIVNVDTVLTFGKDNIQALGMSYKKAENIISIAQRIK